MREIKCVVPTHCTCVVSTHCTCVVPTHSIKGERDQVCSTYILCEQTGQLLLVHVDVLDEPLHQRHRARDVTVSRVAGSTTMWTAVRRRLASQIPGGAGAGPALPDGSGHVFQLLVELPATTDNSHDSHRATGKNEIGLGKRWVQYPDGKPCFCTRLSGKWWRLAIIKLIWLRIDCAAHAAWVIQKYLNRLNGGLH